MSELINNNQKKRDLLKHMIRQLHEGQAPETVKAQLVRLLGQVPYNDVVAVEQELIAEGLPKEEVIKLCDVHAQALKGAIDQTGARTAPAGHPVHTFKEENRALTMEIRSMADLYSALLKVTDSDQHNDILMELRQHFNALMDVEKHYLRKENLLFPYLEQHGITGPPTVMWGKHDETRGLLKAAIEALTIPHITIDEAQTLVRLVLQPASKAVEEMIYKEEEILFPMCLDTLTDAEWYEIYRQSVEIGFCLYDPMDEWKPQGIETKTTKAVDEGKINLPSGSFTMAELTALLNTIPFDLTFVDKEDTVRYFTQGKERIFARNRAILGRKVQQCHPPKSVHIVGQILDDFKSGAQDQAAFWINMAGKFIHIEYFALRDDEGDYLGTLEVSQDLSEKRKLQGEQRLLSYLK